ncbi:MAG: VOC family protein [Planctomycetes bacterium]|nr:VOC family protein [Planctomycetota bacterium]
MVKNPPEGTQRIVPYLYYADAPGAIDFLCKAFGFVERFRMPGPDGGVGHAELALHDEVVMLASVCPDRPMSAPKGLPASHGLVMCYVDDVDAHHARAVAAGAEIVQPLETKFYGDRSYGAKDPDGHTWYFATHVKDVAPEDMHP